MSKTETVTVTQPPDTEQLRQELEQKLSGEQKGQKGKKAFAGFDLKLSYGSASVNVDTVVKFEKLDSKEIDQRLRREIFAEAILPDGAHVCVHNGYAPKGMSRKAWWNEDETQDYPETMIHWYQDTSDGKFEVTPPPRTTELQGKDAETIPMTEVEEWLSESEYTIWAHPKKGSVSALWAIAEDMIKTDTARKCGPFSFGIKNSFRECWAILYPVKRDGEFLLKMRLARVHVHLKHFMPITNGTPAPVPVGPKTTRKAKHTLEA
jgi:hypothetical protein